MTGEQIVNLENKAPGVARALKEACSENRVSWTDLSLREAFDTWLQWEGVIGYTDQILTAVHALGL
jgi:hypothetical protein